MSHFHVFTGWRFVWLITYSGVRHHTSKASMLRITEKGACRTRLLHRPIGASGLWSKLPDARVVCKVGSHHGYSDAPSSEEVQSDFGVDRPRESLAPLPHNRTGLRSYEPGVPRFRIVLFHILERWYAPRSVEDKREFQRRSDPQLRARRSKKPPRSYRVGHRRRLFARWQIRSFRQL